jgi:hypothetical protein
VFLEDMLPMCGVQLQPMIKYILKDDRHSLTRRIAQCVMIDKPPAGRLRGKACFAKMGTFLAQDRSGETSPSLQLGQGTTMRLYLPVAV